MRHDSSMVQQVLQFLIRSSVSAVHGVLQNSAYDLNFLNILVIMPGPCNITPPVSGGGGYYENSKVREADIVI